MKRKIVFFVIIFSTLFANCIYAQEDDDMSLFEIDRLIRKTEYEEALDQLSNYIERNPDNFDNAQTRIKRIMNARKQYSILAEKLIKLIQTDPGNNKEIYEITAQLEKFERHPSDENLQFIADLKKSAEFNYFRAQFLEIQNETAENSKKGDYVAAIEKAKSGFWLYRDDFYEKWEDNPEITKPVDDILEDLNNQIFLYEDKNFIPKIYEPINEFIKAVNQEQYENALDKLKNVENAYLRFNNLRNAIIKDGIMLEERFAEIQKIDSDSTDASFLPFIIRFIFGVDSVPFSGILGALDSQFNDYEGKMNDAVFTVITKKYDSHKKAIDDKYYSEIKKYCELDKKVLDLYLICDRKDDYKLQNPLSEYYVLCDYVNNLSEKAVAVIKIENQVLQIEKNQAVLIEKIKNQKEVQNKTELINDLFNSNSKLSEVTGFKSTYDLSQFDWNKNYILLNKENWNLLTQKYTETVENIFETSSNMLKNSWYEITEYYIQSSESLCLKAEDYNNCTQQYRTGFFTKIPDEILSVINKNIEKAYDYKDKFNENPEMNFGINYSYPLVALNFAAFNQKCIDEDIIKIDEYEKIINNNYQNNQKWKNDENVKKVIVDSVNYLEEQKKKLGLLKNEALNQAELAKNQITASQLARNEGDIRFSEAENALKKDDFDTARKKLQDALAKYDEALSNQNDEKLRTEWDLKLQQLGEQIAKTENEIVVKEVRDLKTKAKDAYFNGRFDDAEKYLNQAKIRWAVTNINEDEEITNLLNFVNTAVSMKTGRDILPSAPQYPEMSQLMNLAYQHFDEGSRFIGDGNKEEGFKELDLALDNIQKLQYVYPLNQEAAILTLRINRLKDPKKFTDEFAQKIEMAKMMCKSKETRQEGYANLLDYYQLEPNYKGLKELIYQVEIDIGIRQKPVDNSGENKARKLIADAKSIYNSAGNNNQKLQQALEKVDAALAIVADNQSAIELKDKITTKIGGNTSTVLSTEDERMYQLAIQRLQNNNVVGAGAIVDQLLKKPQNRNSQKIKDLKNKIDARS